MFFKDLLLDTSYVLQYEIVSVMIINNYSVMRYLNRAWILQIGLGIFRAVVDKHNSVLQA